MDSELDPASTVLAQDIDQQQATDPQPFYDAKLWSIRRLRALGFSNSQVEGMLSIKLKPKHRAD